MGWTGVRFNSGRNTCGIEGQPDRFTAERAHEFQHVRRANGGGGIVFQRVKVHWIEIEEGLVENECYFAVWIVDQREKRDGPGLNAEIFHQALR